MQFGDLGGKSESGDIAGDTFNLGFPFPPKTNMSNLLIGGGILLAAVILFKRL